MPTTDPYTRFVRSGPGRAIATKLGLPRPSRLPRRGDRTAAVLDPVVVLGAGTGAETIAAGLLDGGADVRRRFEDLREVGSVVIVLDEIARPTDIGDIVLPLAGAMRSLAPGARIVTISRPATGGAQDPATEAARGGVEGFVRSLGHEVRRGATANGILVADGIALDAPSVTGALGFLLSARERLRRRAVPHRLHRCRDPARGPPAPARRTHRSGHRRRPRHRRRDRPHPGRRRRAPRAAGRHRGGHRAGPPGQ